MRFPIAMSLKGKSTEAGALEESGSPILKLLSPRRHYDPRRTACRRVAMFDQLGLRFGTLDALGVKSRLVVATTETGYINTQLKFEWYKKCKEMEHCPFGKRPTIPNADSHASNESVEMSAEMELEDKAFLIAPPGHSTHCTQQLDQTGGPIQHNKRITGDLVCNM